MAKLKYGIFGPLSGKLGSVVGSTWKGIPYLRKAPRKKKRRAPRTVAQIANAQKMKFVNEVLIPFHPYINIGFQHLAIEKTALSAAYSVNFQQAITGVYPGLAVDYSKLCISRGKLPGLVNPVAHLNGDTVELNWGKSESKKTSFDDQLMLVLYAPALGLADGFVGLALRRSLRCSFKFNPKMLGQELIAYISMTSMDRKLISDSVYLGRVTP
jgi:hypothetical protein